jgi:hypothetical protein
MSRKSTTTTRPRASRETQNPPPPRFPASGHVTASAKATATAASAAFPPFFRISMPTLAAVSSAAATAPPRPVETCGPTARAGAAARRIARRHEKRRLMSANSIGLALSS